MVEIRTEADLDAMREAGRVVARLLETTERALAAGIEAARADGVRIGDIAHAIATVARTAG